MSETTLKITRAQLLEAAESAIQNAAKGGCPVDVVVEAELMETAATMTRFCGTWKLGDDCGCLVGTWAMAHGHPNGVPSARGAYYVGMAFVDSLCALDVPTNEWDLHSIWTVED